MVNFISLMERLYFVLFSFEGLEGLVVLKEVAAPRIAHPEEVLIRVRAASVDAGKCPRKKTITYDLSHNPLGPLMETLLLLK